MTDVAVIHPAESAPMLPASNAITPSDMIARALERGASIETLEKLITLQERWEAGQARKAYDAAMACAKAEIPVISKNRTVDFTSAKGRTHYRHEDLGEIARTVTPILARFGLSYRFRTSANVNEPVHVTCIISHRDGHFEEVTLPGPRDESGNKNSLQAVGSTLTYLQRMTLKAALGLAASEDDDGKASQTNTANPISADDAASLRAKMQIAGLAEARFCTVMKIETVEDLPSSKYDEAERRIMDFSNAKRARNNAD